MNTKKYFITLFSFIIFSIYFTLSGVFVPVSDFMSCHQIAHIS